MIKTYSFGRMVIKSQTYTSDVILFPDRIDDSWWRKSGHRVCLEDIEDVLREEPEVLVIGTGFYGLMTVQEEVERLTQSRGIELVVKKTKNAILSYNEVASQKKTIGAFHLTC